MRKIKSQTAQFLMAVLIIGMGACADHDPQPLVASELDRLSSNKNDGIHPVPQVPFLLDGMPANASDLLQHKGRLIYLLIGEEPLNIFTKPELAEKYKYERRELLAGHRANPNARGQALILYEHSNFQGGLLDFSYDDWNIRDFRWESWGIFTNINDKVSSICVVTNSNGSGIELFEHINHGGDSFQIYNICHANLSMFGWNDRASSMRACVRLEPVPR